MFANTMYKQVLVFFFFSFQLSLARAGIIVLNGLTHVYKTEKGQVIKGTVQVENTSAQPEDVKLYLQDYSYTAHGSTLYTVPLTNPRSNTGWIRLNTNLITLNSKEKTDILYEIAIPDSVIKPGTYWSVLMVEPAAVIDPVKPGTISISQVTRYAIQLITHIRYDEAKPELWFESVKVENENGTRLLKLAIKNIGDLYSRPMIGVEIFDAKTGEKIGNFPGLPMGILPAASRMFRVDIGALAPSNYTATVLASDEDDHAFAMNIEILVSD